MLRVPVTVASLTPSVDTRCRHDVKVSAIVAPVFLAVVPEIDIIKRENLIDMKWDIVLSHPV